MERRLPEPSDLIRSRRDLLRLGAAGAMGMLALACGARPAPVADAETSVSGELLPPDLTPPPEASVVARPASPAGRSERMLLPNTKWATPLVIAHSGRPGPVIFVLGGVHGDEPGAWAAADEVATWVPRTGSLLVLPRANALAIEAGQRTLPELGDLNRLYPGDPKGKAPMSRMADAIVQVAREFRVQTLYDMHESWAFFSERSANGNAFLGQTVSAGFGEDATLAARALVVRANQRIDLRRDRLAARVEVPAASAKTTNSLGVGRWVEGLSSLLVEMGQDRQEEARRTELHLLVARTFLQSREML